jgi:hypothetical protein
MGEKKNKAFAEEWVEKPIKKKTMFKAKETQKMLQWMKMDSNKLKRAKQIGLEGIFKV